MQIKQNSNSANTAGEQLHYPRESACHYTAIAPASLTESGASRFFEGYHFFSSTGVDGCNDTLACCLTAYNEPLVEYQKSIGGLCACAEFFREKGEERVSREFVICMVIDGLDSMSMDFSAWAEDLGIYDPSSIDDSASFHIFESQVARRKLYFACAEVPSDNSQVYEEKSLQRIILLIKSKNRGKLDSHQCFFDRICSFYSPKYVAQIDVGVIPKKDALYKMWFELQANPNTAATAARSLLPPPENRLGLLQTWQYCDITAERIVNWPSEVFLGNLSVLTGQLSLLRVTSVMDSTRDDKDERILDRYYRGLQDLGPFESNMYLAEDRILGQEMVFKKDKRWELGYQTNAEATIDACQSWAELCRQRRRWICSSMACRIATLKKLPDILHNTSRSAAEKLHKFIAILYFMINSLLEWLVPGIHLIVQATLINHSVASLHSPTLAVAVKFFGVIALASIVIQTIIALTGRLTLFNQRLIHYGLNIQSVNVAFNLVILIASGSHPILVIGFISSLILYILIAYSYSRMLAKDVALTLLQYMCCRLPVKAFLMTYSTFHSHDTSWGTKGLDASGHINKSIRRRQEYKVFRMLTLSFFLIINVSLFCYFYVWDSFKGIYFLYAITAILILQLMIGVFAALKLKLASRKKNL